MVHLRMSQTMKVFEMHLAAFQLEKMRKRLTHRDFRMNVTKIPIFYNVASKPQMEKAIMMREEVKPNYYIN